mgnify:CR=1 FL=1
MVDITDTNNTRGKLEREWEMLDEADIDSADREAIKAFAEHRLDIENRALNTVINDLGNLRRASVRAETPLLEMDIGDARAFVGRLTDPKDVGGYGLDPDGGGIFGYKRALRVFFNWLDEEPGYGEYPFGERIELPKNDPEDSKITREDLLDEDEIEQMKTAAANRRDPALIDFLADVGARISLATSLRVGDVDGLDSNDPSFRPNSEAIGLKGVEDKPYPILYSRAELREWVNRHHPEAPDPPDDAPLFPRILDYDPDRRSEMAASGDTIRDALARISKKAEIGRKVHPHHFRHVFMTRLYTSDLEDRDIEHMSMLSDDQMRMLDRYDHTSDDERARQIHERLGFADPDAAEDDETAVELVTCYNCKSEVKSTSHYCPRCSIALKDEMRHAVEQTNEEMDRVQIDSDSKREREAARDIRRAAENDPALAEALAEEFSNLAGGE